MNPKLVFFSLIAGVFTFQSCTFEKVEPAIPVIVDTTVSYSASIVPLLNSKCNSCHSTSGSGNGDFTIYTGIKAKVDNGSLYNRIVLLKDMPVINSGNVITDEDRAKFESWINQGGKNN